MAISFIGGGNRSTLRKTPTCHKSYKVLPSSELDAVAKQMEEEERKKEELKRQEEDWQKAEEARIRRDKRERVIDELIQTERDYLHGLFNATFNNISVISWRSVLLVEETGVLGRNHRSASSH
jgi:hypothetical protein